MRMMATRYGSPQPARVKPNASQIAHVSAPLKGLNLSSKLSVGDPLTAPVLTNFLVEDDRITVRSGTKKMPTNIGAAVETLVPWYGANPKLAAAGGGKIVHVQDGAVLKTGFTGNVLALNVPVVSYERKPAEVATLYKEVLRRIGELPGVDQVALGTVVPWRDPGFFAAQFTVEGYRKANGEEDPRARFRTVSPGFFSALGVKMIGEEKVYYSVNILFNAELTQWVKDRPAALYFVEQEDLRATFLTINGTDRWGFLIHSRTAYGWKPEDFTPEFCAKLIRKGVGIPDIPVKVLGVYVVKAGEPLAKPAP